MVSNPWIVENWSNDLIHPPFSYLLFVGHVVATVGKDGGGSILFHCNGRSFSADSILKRFTDTFEKQN
jgi:hypothetical protein